MAKSDIDNNRRFEMMLSRYGKHIQRYCAIHGNNSDEIRDLISAVCDELWRSIGNLRNSVSSPQANVWLYRVMYHAVHDYFRRKRRARTVSIGNHEELPAPNDEKRELLYDMVQYLPEQDQSFIKRHLEGYTLAEMAVELGISYDSCCQRKSRIIKKLNIIYQKYYV